MKGCTGNATTTKSWKALTSTPMVSQTSLPYAESLSSREYAWTVLSTLLLLILSNRDGINIVAQVRAGGITEDFGLFASSISASSRMF